MKDLKIKYNKIIPFRGYFAMCLFNAIYIRDFNKHRPVYKSTINHEGIHVCQMEDFVPNRNNRKIKIILGGCIFYILYFIEWLIKLLISISTFGKIKAYRSISFEQEAYCNQYNYDYQKTRSRFAWTKYIFKFCKIMTFKGTDNFKVSELEYSDTARQYKINNTIPSELEFNVKRLLFFLQDIREKWGSAIKITSGYRCATLNKLVKGSKTSAHLMCNAVDIWPINGKFEEFKKFIVSYLSDKNFDQCIIEKSGKSQWIHLGLYNNSERQRRQIFKLEQ